MREKKVLLNDKICAVRTRGFKVKRKLSSKTKSKLIFYNNQKFCNVWQYGSCYDKAVLKLGRQNYT